LAALERRRRVSAPSRARRLTTGLLGPGLSGVELLGLALLGLGLLANCSRQARAVRVTGADPNAEIYSISCRATIQHCRDKATELCGSEYQVLQSSGINVEPPRVSSAPGPRSTASRYQRADWMGELIVACGGHEPSSATPLEPVAPPPNEPVRTLATDQLCVPGITQLCLGAGACRGAQACLEDGRGYGPCDCGTVTTRDAGLQ
jgi:hypothetical protein